MSNLLIVESPAKAKTIEKYLGKDFHVLASVGHIRTDTKVDKNTFEVTYSIDPDHRQVLKSIQKAAKTATKVWLATDEDREGEAISWHLAEVLKLPKDTPRITFHEITKSALTNAIQHPRTIDMAMVSSQQARQTLDMLVGYDLSDLVRRKVPGAKSAGRVQSPALRLIVEREKEIEHFTAPCSFKVSADFGFPATLNHDFAQEKDALAFLKQLQSVKEQGKRFQITAVTTTPSTRNPLPPFTTASMQIEASNKLGFSTSTTMRAAQSLYQAGLITYHRTDSLNLSREAIASMATFIRAHYGEKYLKTRNFKTKQADAQEAHEAIRPTHIEQENVSKNSFEQKLYTLIRNRALATQMAPAKLDKTKVTISTPTPYYFTGTGEVIVFDGFLKVYGKTKDKRLPSLKQGSFLSAKSISAKQTFAKAPARYSEGSLVKKLEELGIGRPSTYASIIAAIQARGYVVKGDSEGEARELTLLKLEDETIHRESVREKTGANRGKLLPTPIGELVAGFLNQHFADIVDYQFTARVEDDLDAIANRKLARKTMLKNFYSQFSRALDKAQDAARFNNANKLGEDPKTGLPIFTKTGKNGSFIQLGENEKISGQKPRFAPLPKGVRVNEVTLAQAIEQLSLPALPRSLGKSADGTELIAAAGPFGPYLKAGKFNIPMKDLDPYTVDFANADALYLKKRASILKDWGDVQLIQGVYGPYLKGPGRRNHAKLPKDTDPKTLTQAKALEVLAASGKKRPTRRRTAGKKARTTKPKRKLKNKIKKKQP